MTDEATRLALADEIEESFNDDRMLDLVLLRDERRLIVAALRAIPQEPVRWPNDGELLELMYAAGYDGSEVHHECYRRFGWKTFTEKLKAALYAAPIQSSDGDVEGHVETKTGELQDRRSALIHPEAGIKPGPSEPIAQGQREAIARATGILSGELRGSVAEFLGWLTGLTPPSDQESIPPEMRQAFDKMLGRLVEASKHFALATLPQPPAEKSDSQKHIVAAQPSVGACREALRALKPFADAFTAATEKGFRYNNEAVGYMGEKVSFQDFARAFDTLAALAPSAQEGETTLPLCSCKASQRDGQHMAWCPSLSRPERG